MSATPYEKAHNFALDIVPELMGMKGQNPCSNLKFDLNEDGDCVLSCVFSRILYSQSEMAVLIREAEECGFEDMEVSASWVSRTFTCRVPASREAQLG